MPPTIILVHGAFAESASWDGVIDPLQSAGHPTRAAVAQAIAVLRQALHSA